MDRSATARIRKLLLAFSVSINLGLLFYFKYSGFFLENVNLLFHAAGINEIRFVKLLLPIGISFYTFETITYVVDVYRRVHAPLKKFWDYQLYIILFPKLIAGPIVRFHEIADQITDRCEWENNTERLAGFVRFSIGLGKKILIANEVGYYADTIFAMSPGDYNTATAWLGILAYTLQIYFDFSGYSDMAIGICRILGFRLPENFNSPYISAGITEFWRRWHMTLGSWMKNYLYIPIGGNKGSEIITYRNLVIVFLASGLWHGASWNFIIWGAFHGFFLVAERAGLGNLYKRTGRLIAVIITFIIVMNGWVLFRIEGFNNAMHFYAKLYKFDTLSPFIIPDKGLYSIILIALFFSLFEGIPLLNRLQKYFYIPKRSAVNYFAVLIAFAVFVISAARIAVSDFNPFIYFRF